MSPCPASQPWGLYLPLGPQREASVSRDRPHHRLSLGPASFGLLPSGSLAVAGVGQDGALGPLSSLSFCPAPPPPRGALALLWVSVLSVVSSRGIVVAPRTATGSVGSGTYQ